MHLNDRLRFWSDLLEDFLRLQSDGKLVQSPPAEAIDVLSYQREGLDAGANLAQRLLDRKCRYRHMGGVWFSLSRSRRARIRITQVCDETQPTSLFSYDKTATHGFDSQRMPQEWRDSLPRTSSTVLRHRGK